MAIYSLNHKSIGKQTQARPHTAAAHIRYITRDRAVSQVTGARMPLTRHEAMAFLVKGEDGDRKNARVADKIMVALPRELSAGQRLELVRAFAEDLTQGRAPWFAAIHDKGKDAKNPHCHIIVRDRDPATGRRVIGLSEAGSTNHVREVWERHSNQALALAGERSRIDRRTLKAQGIAREPTLHVGVRARQLLRAKLRPSSRIRTIPNGCRAKSRTRRVDYPAIDGGRTRLEHNITLIRKNIYRSRSRNEEREFWDAIDRDSLQRDMDMLRRAHGVVNEPEYGRRDRTIDEDFDR